MRNPGRAARPKVGNPPKPVYQILSGVDGRLSQNPCGGNRAMKELLDKLSSYNLFDYLLPGTAFLEQ
jgi:hypothetical protein